MLFAAGCVFTLRSSVVSLQLRAERDPSEDVCPHSAGSAALEELHLQKETNGEDN